jgi:hypothetical protein
MRNENKIRARAKCQCALTVPPEARPRIGIDQYVCGAHSGRGVFLLASELKPLCCGQCTEDSPAGLLEACKSALATLNTICPDSHDVLKQKLSAAIAKAGFV